MYRILKILLKNHQFNTHAMNVHWKCNPHVSGAFLTSVAVLKNNF